MWDISTVGYLARDNICQGGMYVSAGHISVGDIYIRQSGVSIVVRHMSARDIFPCGIYVSVAYLLVSAYPSNALKTALIITERLRRQTSASRKRCKQGNLVLPKVIHGIGHSFCGFSVILIQIIDCT